MATTRPDCVFCAIARGAVAANVIWESEAHVAFLSTRPNTVGATVVIPREHWDSYAFALPDDVLCGLTLAAKRVALLLDAKLADVGRTGMVYEGFGVNHVHAKLFPMHGTTREAWQPIVSDIDTVFDRYPGYLSSHDARPADPGELGRLAEHIRS